MQQPPAWVIQSWPTPNFVDPVTHGLGNVILNIVLYTILCCFMALRIWTRTILRASFGSDDVMILCAMAPTTAFFILSLLADLKFHWIRHQYDIPISQVEFGLKMVIIVEVMFTAACTLTKLSMLLLVRRMLISASRFWRRVTLGAICIVGLQGSLFCIILVFQCRPIQDYWKATQGPQPNCIHQSSTLLTAGIINTVTEFLVVLLPIRTVYSTKLPRRQQLLVSLLFILGLFSCFAGIARTYFMYAVTQVWDQVWASYPVWICAAIELYIGIICTSIPATKPFFVTYIPSFFSARLSHTPRTSYDRHPSYNPYFNFKGDPIPYPGFGVTSTSKSHAEVLPREAPTAPTGTHLSAENPPHDRTVGTFLAIARTSSTRRRPNEKNDEKTGVGNAAGSPSSLSSESRRSSPDGPSNSPNSSSTPRGTTGSEGRQRGRTRDRGGHGDFPSRASSVERKQRAHPAEKRQETDGGWDIHIDIVKTIVIEEEHIKE